jgi:penicillin-binding protein 1A
MKIVYRILGVGLALGILGVISVAAVVSYYSFQLPNIQSLSDYNPPIPSQIVSKDGVVLAELGKEIREVVPVEDVPQRIVDAFLSAEDRSFYEHSGVNYWGVLRALIVNIKAGRVVQGGSTITQQVAKSLLLTRERSIARKIKDFLLALRIEKHLSKKEILFLYLNQVYLGGGYYGVKAAFRGYFDKDLSEATVAESAMVAGLLVAPGKYSPYVNPRSAKKRQRYVLNRMYKNGKITKEEYEESLKEFIRYRIRKGGKFKAGYFTDWVRQRVIELVGEENFLNNGFKVSTTLNYELQQIAEDAVSKGVKGVDKRQGFKGPIGKVEDVAAYEKKFLTALFKEKSQYFTVDELFAKKLEVEFDEELYNNAVEFRNLEQEKIPYKNILAGYSKDHQALEFLEENKSYKAVVIGMSDLAEVVWVSIGGVVGVIPQKGFEWAHERLISEKREYFPRIRKPSRILSTGDEVLVKITKKKNKGISFYSDPFKKKVAKIKKKELKAAIYNQSYLMCELDQEADVQGALVSLSPTSGEVVSLVGGANFSKSQFNRATQSKRQPGSSFKPILFAAGLENGYTPSTIIIDSPEALGGGEDALSWKPRNYDGKFKGPMTFRNSLEVSRNVPTIKLARRLGVNTIIDFVERIGFNAEIDRDYSLALGAFGVTLLDLVTTYAIFPNGGVRIKPKSIISITDRSGKTYEFRESDNLAKLIQDEPESEETDAKPQEKEGEVAKAQESEEEPEEEKDSVVNPYIAGLSGDQVYDRRLAYIMTNIMKGVVHYGTGRSAKKVSLFLGGKTGTTNNYVDAWFTGFSHNLVTGVWTGFDNNKTLGWGETGAKGALPIWNQFMKAGKETFGEREFKTPEGIVHVLIDKQTGKSSDDMDKGFREAFVEGTEPGASDDERLNIGFDTNTGSENSTLDEDDDYYNQQ